MDSILKCISKASEFMDRICGVCDAHGCILASTEASLVGTHDMNASELLESVDHLAVSSGFSYIKVFDKHGASWIVFVEGDDQSSLLSLQLLSQWVLTEIDVSYNNVSNDAFLKNVLFENELPGDIPLKCAGMKIPFYARRVALLFSMERINWTAIAEHLKNFLHSKDDFVVSMDENTVVVLKTLASDAPEDLENLVNFLQETLFDKPLFEGLAVGIGMPVDDLRSCAKSYREASLAHTVGEIFTKTTLIRRYDKLGLSRLIYQLPATLCHMFLNEVFPQNTYELLDEETLLTIERFFDNNLNGSETSRQLFVHRNTLVYRLDKVQKITGLDLRSFDDAVLFKLGSMVRRYLETLPSSQLKYINKKRMF